MILSRFLSKTNKQSITTLPWIVVMLLFFSLSCKKEDKEVVEVTFDPETTYTMKTTFVNSLISDSGVTRYRVVAKEWLDFGKAEDPYWYFPEGFYFEKFDSVFHAEATAKSDTAYYWQKKDLAKLVGNVEIENFKGENFKTSLLYWNMKEERFYSDQYIRIEQEDKIITGIGFESNGDMTKYRIFQSSGEFPVSESSNDSIPRDSTRVRPQTAPTDNRIPFVPAPRTRDSIPAGSDIEELIELIEELPVETIPEEIDPEQINDI